MTAHYATVIEKNKAAEQIRRDPLAADRTILANERTMLAYIRTAVTLFAGGFSFINFFPAIGVRMVGWIILVPAVVTLYIGAQRYLQLRQSITSSLSD